MRVVIVFDTEGLRRAQLDLPEFYESLKRAALSNAGPRTIYSMSAPIGNVVWRGLPSEHPVLRLDGFRADIIGDGGQTGTTRS